MTQPRWDGRDAAGAPPESPSLSNWLIAGGTMLAGALFLDEVLGVTITASVTRPTGLAGSWRLLAYAAALGLSPVVTITGLLVSGWLLRLRRYQAAAAMATVSLVAIAFSARPLVAGDIIGWREAVRTAAIAGRTIATTATAMVFGSVMFRERLLPRPVAIGAGLGFPVLIGASRVLLGLYSVTVVIGQWLVGAVMATGIVCAYIVMTREKSVSVVQEL